MTSDLCIETIDTHTAGEPTRIIVDGVEWTLQEGLSVREQRDAFEETADDVRELLLCEPRGHDDMFGAVLVEPEQPEADLGVFFMDTGGYLDMCIHGTIGVITGLLESGDLELKTELVAETPAGLVTARPSINNGRVTEVSIINVKSWYHSTESVSTGSTAGRVPVDIVSAGNTVGLIDAAELPLAVTMENTNEFIKLGLKIKGQLHSQMDSDDVPPVSLIEFFEKREAVDRNIVVFGNGSVDRSPCGTGTCAKLVLLHRNGELDVAEPYEYESVIGTRFVGRILDIAESTDTALITPAVTGSAHIIARSEFVRSASDSLAGFRLDGT